ncbi:MAG TPA: TldD/PmbA family protein [Acidimicrobiales bacterium]|jgi:PmbA protein
MAELTDIVERIVGWAGDDEQVEAYASWGRDTDIEVYERDIESLSSAETQGVGIRVVKDGRQGFAYAASFDTDVLEETFAEARDNATFTEPDEWNGLTEPDGVAEATIEVWDGRLADVATADKVDLALRLERLVAEGDARIRAIESAAYGDAIVERALATTTGIRSALRRTVCSIAAYALAGEPDDTQTGFGFSVGRHVDDLDLDRAAADTVDRATRMLGATKPESLRTTVVLDPFVTSQFLSIIGSTLNGESVLKGRSLFADRLGESVAAVGVTLVDDPTDVRTYGASPTDGEGLASRRNALIDAGVLQQYVYDTYSGRRSGAGSNACAVRGGFKGSPGPGCRALVLEPGPMSPDELLASVSDGVLIQSVKGMHSGVNPISGDFSTGADGLRITDGALGEPLREFTIGSTIQKMLQGVIAVGNDLEFLPFSAAGQSLAISDVTISGT